MSAKLRLLFAGVAVVLCLVSCARNSTPTPEQIDALFEPITSTYGIRIVYEIDDEFPPILIGGGGAHAKLCELEPIDLAVLARYPAILEAALSRYPPHVIEKYLNAVYFAGTMIDYGIGAVGTYDIFRRIIYLIDDGSRTDQEAIATFHHEMSSLLPFRRSEFLNPWEEQNPEGFQYFSEIYHSQDDIYAGTSTLDGSEEIYEMGFMNSYGFTNLENDYNEYAKMIFTNPEKFRELMERYPRIRGKFDMFLKIYQSVDPIFTEEYLLGPPPSSSP